VAGFLLGLAVGYLQDQGVGFQLDLEAVYLQDRVVDSQRVQVVDFRLVLAVGVQPDRAAVFQQDPVVDAQQDLVKILIHGTVLTLIVKPGKGAWHIRIPGTG